MQNRGIRRLSVSKDGDYLPHTLDDGLIAYTRWEYHERSWAFIQSIWTIRPDGTGADALFKQHMVDPWALEDVRSIPRFISISQGKRADVRILDELLLEPGSFYVMDRGYVDFRRLSLTWKRRPVEMPRSARQVQVSLA